MSSPGAAFAGDLLVQYDHPELLTKKEVRAREVDGTSPRAAAARGTLLNCLCCAIQGYTERKGLARRTDTIEFHREETR